ncbi:MAG: hypothetical protein H7338_11680, partial [Candidatus Sericytochromatia bacterium]|nr:hypothetical protein [Candidatus Sericytochromatia bacterium]
VAHIVRDLRHEPIDLALSTAGVMWLLAKDGIWQRPVAGGTDWVKEGELESVGIRDAAAVPQPELTTDSKGVPWLLHPTTGTLWTRTDTAVWQPAATGLIGATGLTIGPDGTAYAVAPGTPGDLLKVSGGTSTRIANEGWKQPVVTGFDIKGNLFVVDAAARLVALVNSAVKLYTIPQSLGRLTIGRDAEGAPLIVGGKNAVIAIKVGDKSLSFPSIPTTALPIVTSAFTALRFYGLPASQYLCMARFGEGAAAGGELRLVTVPVRVSGAQYLPGSSFQGTPLTLRALAQREADKIEPGYRLTAIHGVQKEPACDNRVAPWVFDYRKVGSDKQLSISLGALGLLSDQTFLSSSAPAGVPLVDVPLDAHQAWAAAVKAGMPNAIKAEVSLAQSNETAYWRFLWTSGGQTYRVNAITGQAGLDS